MEYKHLPILSKEIGDDRIVRSLFAVAGHIDSYGDRIHPGAFAKTLMERIDRVKVLWQHDMMSPPIAVPVALKEMPRQDMPLAVLERFPDASGALYGEVRFLDTPRANEVLTGIREGAITENSIGYDAVKFDFEELNGETVRNLRELRLWDVSPVVWGAQPAALNVKSGLPGELVELAAAVDSALRPGALKEGRVLSARNLDKLKTALETLQAILLAAEPPDDEESAKALTAQLLQRLAIAERDILAR